MAKEALPVKQLVAGPVGLSEAVWVGVGSSASSTVTVTHHTLSVSRTFFVSDRVAIVSVPFPAHLQRDKTFDF